MNCEYKFTIVFQVKIKAEDVESASLEMRRQVEEIYWMTGSDEFSIELESIMNPNSEPIYVSGINFYPDGMNPVIG